MRNRNRAILLTALLAPVFLAPVHGTENPAPKPEAELKNLLLQDCGSCHGITLKGGLGPPLLPRNLEHLSVDAVTAIIREGIPGTAMPSWKLLLAPEDMQWIGRQLKEGTATSL
ncbi:MAG TPA: cytochrome c [Marinobacter sp.]|nr:cytochrome c [Marinobacter sp.]